MYLLEQLDEVEGEKNKKFIYLFLDCIDLISQYDKEANHKEWIAH